MKKDIVHNKWIKISMGMCAGSTHLIEMKKQMKEYAEELDWEIEVDKEGYISEGGTRMYDINILPKGKLISPEEYRKIYNKLLGFSLRLLADVMKEDVSNLEATFTQQSSSLLTAKKSEEVIMIMNIHKTLMVEYSLVDRLKLEEKEPHLARLIFFETVEQMFKKFKLGTGFFNNFSQSKDMIKAKDDLKKRLEEWFGIEVGKGKIFGR